MQEVTITMKLRVKDDACLADWVPQSIIDQLEDGEELLAYDDTERVWTAEELATSP
jgi:chorismate-pyruvate lyase